MERFTKVNRLTPPPYTWNPVQHRQDARYEAQLVKIAGVLDRYLDFPKDRYVSSVEIMSQLELFFFEEFEIERKARKNK